MTMYGNQSCGQVENRQYKSPPAADCVADTYYPENFHGKIRAQGLGAGMPPVAVAEIPLAVANTHNALDRLSKSTSLLEGRLSAVMRQPSVDKECASPVPVTSCQLHDSLVNIEERVLAAARYVESLIERLAL
jgi:hypothetical protein